MAFSERLGHSESGGRYNIRNDEGYTGKYQFGMPRLTDYMRATGSNFTLDEFQQNGPLQEAVYKWHEADIDRRLGDLVGREVNGQVMDQNALRAVAHLGGIGGARQYVTSGGAYNPADSNGTSLSDYARKLGGQGSGVQSNALAGASPAALAAFGQSLPNDMGQASGGYNAAASAAAQKEAHDADIFAMLQGGMPKANALDASAFQINPQTIIRGWR